MSERKTLSTETVGECVEHICSGQLSSEQLVQHHLGIIADNDEQIKAWVHFDAEKALENAKAMDDIRRHGQPVGALHGIPIGVKDIYDTADYPTEYGSSIHAGRQPTQDCVAVSRLKEAGAVIMGKTVTTEFAFMHPSDTHNPHNLDYSPGGSSSGSAASVAAGHVPLAVGSQTNGSVIRPASFCGVYGYKPSAGVISRTGLLATSPTLDNVGVFGRNLEDMARLADALAGYDPADVASYVQPKPSALQGYLSDAPVPPALVWIDMPYADQYAPDVTEGFEELLGELGSMVERIPAPQSFKALLPCHKIIQGYEILRGLNHEIKNHWSEINDSIKPLLEEAQAVSDEAYQEALEVRVGAIDWFRQFFHDYDAIVTPSALGEAPLMGSTGDPICCTIWTLAGLPCLNLPLLGGENELPIGVQLVGAARQDDRLFRTARYVLEQLRAEQVSSQQESSA